ncbi:hypothetical protein HN014_22150 (plasmid) [Aquimarina sp. TRL1]|uniref:hypothetical protein n=1 Tax=Aquimarina sp. (strain TRL1) TaxID=2736252 RepID=UPI001588C11F|nr:hypothetical protein [Aquimarina sp. TRL1]QKX07704.1 hypothetical protein HN014_22150 [Aquimarina sp. TRL1]
MSKKQYKQETFDEDVSFSGGKSGFKNISSAAEKFNSDIKPINQPKSEEKEKGFKLVVHYQTFDRFMVCQRKYEDLIYKKFRTTRARKYFLTATIQYWVDYLKSNNLYKEAPGNFIYNATRKGRRKKNERSFSSSEKVEEFFGISNQIYTSYFDLMFSFVEANNKLDPSIFTTSYFFYDLVDFTEKHIDKIIQWEIDNSNLTPYNE